MLRHFHVPQILLCFRLRRDDLAAVDHGAAAHRKNEINAFLLRQLCALLHLCIGGVGHDAGEINDPFSGRLKDSLQLIVNSVLFHRTAAVCQHYIFSIGGNRIRKMLFCRPFSKVNLRSVLIHKLLHGKSLLSFFHFQLFSNIPDNHSS